MIEIHDALERIDANVTRGGSESIQLAEAVGRYLAVDVQSDVDSPPHNKSIMDGFAVRAEDVEFGAELSVIETVPAGSVPTKTVTAGLATRIMTGAPMPDGADAVVMIERTVFDEAGQTVKLELEQLKPGRHVMPRAASMSAGQTVMSSGHRVRPSDIGLLAESGAADIWAISQPSIAILPTGDELVAVNEKPGPGLIRNSNGPMLVALARSQTSQVRDLGIGRDNREELAQKVADGLESDFLILSGGVSAGMLDLVPAVLSELGVEEIFHKVAVKPGKPIWFGVANRNGNRCHVFGLPGNPVSSLVGFHLFVRAAISKFCGGSVNQESRISEAVLDSPHEVRGNRMTYWPTQVVNQEIARSAKPIPWRGSSDLRALHSANGLGIFHPEQAYPVGTKIRVMDLDS